MLEYGGCGASATIYLALTSHLWVGNDNGLWDKHKLKFDWFQLAWLGLQLLNV